LTDKKFHQCDKVEWQSHGVTGRTVRASQDEPQYQVRGDKTGADAVHRPSALRRHLY
jgi:hypothetical protein